jgi:hexosaminidase
MCSWISYWKQNTFHIHLSDNLYNNPNYTYVEQLNLYARFRLWSDDSAVAGLNKRKNESYTRQDFDDVQYGCAARGVTIIPEIEAPGHALVISQWKPELALTGAIDLLNISYPDTIPTMETIWKTFLPWFHSKAVHIGADEYTSTTETTYELAEAYNTFVNTMDDYIGSESGKQMRIWGTYPPQSNYTDNIDKNVTVQHWEFFEDNPLFDYIDNGYQVINSDDTFYIVNKYSESYPQILNRTAIFHGNPATGGGFAPNIFDPNNATNDPPRDSPYVSGHIAAQWNDFGYNASTYLEAYYSWRDLLPALADKQWGGNITETLYYQVFETLQKSAPAQNLDRTIESKGSTIVEYDFANINGTAVPDLSGNGYGGTTNCPTTNGSLVFSSSQNCTLETPLGSKGRNYTLSFSILQSPSSGPGPLFRGPDSELWSGNGTSTQVTLITAGYGFALNYSLPTGAWTDVSLVGRGNRTFLAVDGGSEMEFTTKIGVDGEYFVWREISVVAPLHYFGGGGWEGQLKSIKLVDYA